MSRFWSPLVERLSPYTPGEQADARRFLKLNTNESPFAPSPEVLRAICEAANADLRLYPEPGSDRLRSAISRTYGVPAESIFVGNGADEVLAHAFCAFFKQDAPILLPDVTYAFYETYCSLYDIRYRTIALDEDFRIDLESYSAPNGGIIFANPNSPTSRAVSRQAVEGLLETNRDSVVVVDEAYVDFGGDSVVPLISRYDNLLVVQTFSKSRSLAGLRVGFAFGAPDLIEGLNRVKSSFNSYPVDRVASAAAIAALADTEDFDRKRGLIVANRVTLSGELARLGFRVLPALANFVFAAHSEIDGKVLQGRLRERGVLVRRFDRHRIGQFLRISVGTMDQMRTLVDSLGEILTTADHR